MRLVDILQKADGSPVTCFVCKPTSAEAEKTGSGERQCGRKEKLV